MSAPIRAHIVSCGNFARAPHIFIRSDPDCAEKIVRKLFPKGESKKNPWPVQNATDGMDTDGAPIKTSQR